MLEKDPKKRITISQALEHPFIKENKYSEWHTHDVSIKKDLDSEVLKKIRSFKCQNRLKKAAIDVFVEHLDPHQILDLQKIFTQFDT